MHGADRVIVVGEALVDIAVGAPAAHGGLALTARAGGSPANVAAGLGRLGVPTAFAGRLSGEGFGSFLRAHLVASGVDVGLSVSAPEPATLAIVAIAADGSAAYSFYVDGTADWQWAREELPTPEAGAAVHTGSLAIALEPGAAILATWLAETRARGDVFVSIDPNVRPSLVLHRPGFREHVEALVELAHLVKVSDEDLGALEPGVEPLETARAWSERGPELVVVTHGARGSTALRAGTEPIHCDATAVRVVDTIGAGDAFTAGLLAFLAERDALRPGRCASLDGSALADALRFAGRVAALTCSRAGADPPWRAELES